MASHRGKVDQDQYAHDANGDTSVPVSCSCSTAARVGDDGQHRERPGRCGSPQDQRHEDHDPGVAGHVPHAWARSRRRAGGGSQPIRWRLRANSDLAQAPDRVRQQHAEHRARTACPQAK
jgi:hypothetical protein